MIVRCYELFTPRWTRRYRRVDAYLLAHVGVDPAILAADLGEAHVQTRQRKLGLRKCKHTPRMGDRA